MSDGGPRWQNRGTVDAGDGRSQGCRGSLGIVSMEGVSGRGSRSLFTGRMGKAILAEWVLIVRKRGGQTREATEPSEVGRSIINRVRNAPCGRENLLQGARADRRSAWSVVKRTKHRQQRGQLRMRSVAERSERFSKSVCDWHSSVVRISDRAPSSVERLVSSAT